MRLLLGLALLLAAAAAIGQDDMVKDLPGLLFKPNFQTYSGYLNANEDKNWQMHYWLFESRNDKDKDPVLVWLNGGPGCSSVAGMFEELGPFYVTFDGQSLFENVHSWNQRANVLALESPIGVGFSYDTKVANFSKANDDQTASQNYQALKDFFTRVQKTYGDRDFYLSGESYAGIYIPTLSKLLVDGIKSGDFPNKNFRGAAIGNGFMDVPKLMNSLVSWGNYHGRMSPEDWDTVKSQCSTGGQDVEKYDFTKYFKTDNGMDYYSDGSLCGNLTAPMLVLDDNMDQYNYYQDCYAGTSIVLPNVGRGAKGIKRRRPKRSAAWKIVNSENPAETVSGYEILHDRLAIIRALDLEKKTLIGLERIRKLQSILKKIIGNRFKVSYELFAKLQDYLQESEWLSDSDIYRVDLLSQFQIILGEMKLSIALDEKDMNIKNWRRINRVITPKYFEYSKRSTGCAQFDTVHPFLSMYDGVNGIEIILELPDWHASLIRLASGFK